MKRAEFGVTPLVVGDRFTMACLFPERDEHGNYASAESYRFLYRTYCPNVPKQTHSVNVGVLDRPGQRFEDTDALVTFIEDVPVGVLTADCVPLVMFAPDVEGKAAVHAGWKGTLGGIVDNTLDVLEERGADLSQLVVAIGPAIHVESYEVGHDLADRFAEAGFGEFVVWPEVKDGKPHVDLVGVNKERLVRRGVKPENILVHDADTFGFEEDGFHFPSYRRDSTSLRILTFVR